MSPLAAFGPITIRFRKRPSTCESRSARDSGADGGLTDAVDAAAELVAIGKDRWDAERLLTLAGEAVIGRIGDIATKLPAELVTATAEVPWAEIRGMRIVVDHAYHSIDYERVWRTLQDDVPELNRSVSRWIDRQLGQELRRDDQFAKERDQGPDLGLGL